MFTELFKVIPEDGTLRLTLVKKNGKMTMTALPVFPVDEITIPGKSAHDKTTIGMKNLVPLVMSGTPEEFDEGFIQAITEYAPAVTGFQSNLTEAKGTFDAKIAAMEAKEEEKKAKKKTTTTAPAAPGIDRNEGEADETKFKMLTTVSSTDGAFKNTLKNSNLKTLEAALLLKLAIANSKAIAKEIGCISGESEADILTPILCTKYKAETDSSIKAEIGKQLVKISGKSLADLALVAKPLSLI